MFPDDTRRKIEDIVSGNVVAGEANHCIAIRNHLCHSFGTSTTVKKGFESNAVIKEEQASFIERYCEEHGFWYTDLPGDDRYLTRGGEARIYLHTDNKRVVKLNDAIYYATWLEFFNSVLLHNVIFENTAYTLTGFGKDGDSLLAVLEQPFIVADGQVELADIQKMLEYNGFKNTRRNDYLHAGLGLILEDIHDENVIVNSEMLFVIDSVFYTVRPAH